MRAPVSETTDGCGQSRPLARVRQATFCRAHTKGIGFFPGFCNSHDRARKDRLGLVGLRTPSRSSGEPGRSDAPRCCEAPAGHAPVHSTAFVLPGDVDLDDRSSFEWTSPGELSKVGDLISRATAINQHARVLHGDGAACRVEWETWPFVLLHSPSSGRSDTASTCLPCRQL
ncbi:hypothetical protein B0H67DRAFT_303340 [Lasiosphaeris hirsuta]|uniref:Uncharacterized protein n=1 Tax=Lasiosphaeris hirsuta TaxID=260670 RepID=A0AA40A9T5_9PEZI|nr:hypothetical protein B0H67DRAFT_303340 [Lasiosphaeris hirsuta]